MQNAEPPQRPLEPDDNAGRMDTLRVSVLQMRSGQTVPAEEVLAEMRKMLSEARNSDNHTRS